ncbi:polysaccharide deacetylase [Oceanihabitans sediminis]|uniref:Polysaccharide deacetylase family protein n=1 Tax=Oceanihabitans sediminis TaxID=1812012 RepID=A0A368P939_9FLAO|nr:polysaccharide deacetylase family protein [Oceanihabitans sediminis]RBP27059.1 polysaccharide deacetylase [Oceanihabitans sediminis]RCU58624.1 polysaccharide deacetylase family protein [Oceanihabitans sediminis]
MRYIKRLILHVIKEIIGFIFLNFGGVYLLKNSIKGDNYLVILNYHNFSKYNNYKIIRGKILETDFASNFNKQIRFLKKHFNFTYPEEFFPNNRVDRINVLITFDDGYKDNYDIALPVLKKHNAKAIFFIVTNVIGTKKWLTHDILRYLVQTGIKSENEIETLLKEMNQGESIMDWLNKNKACLMQHPSHRIMMNWDEVNKISKEGFKIAPHTHNHEILSFLNFNAQKDEVYNSIITIKHKLSIDSKYFAYPNGLYNEESIQILNKNHIQYSFTTKPGFNTLTDKPYELKRIGVNASDSLGVLLLKLYLNRKK